ncbi:MAG: hypothetical protein ACOCYQ_01155 [Alkalispirochaeta sp.]
MKHVISTIILLFTLIIGTTLYASPPGGVLAATETPDPSHVEIASIPVDDEWILTFTARTRVIDPWEAPIASLRHIDGHTVTLPGEYVWLQSGESFATVVDGVIYAQGRRYGETGIYRILPGDEPDITRISRPGDNTFWWQTDQYRNNGPIFVVGADHVVAYVAFASRNSSTDLTAGITDVTVLVSADPSHRTEPGQQTFHHHVVAEQRLPIWTSPDGHLYLLRPQTGEIQRVSDITSPRTDATPDPDADPSGITLEPYTTVDTTNGSLDWRTTLICTIDDRVVGIDANRTVTELYRPADSSAPPALRTAAIPGYGMMSEIECIPGDKITFTLNRARATFDLDTFTLRD